MGCNVLIILEFFTVALHNGRVVIRYKNAPNLVFLGDYIEGIFCKGKA